MSTPLAANLTVAAVFGALAFVFWRLSVANRRVNAALADLPERPPAAADNEPGHNLADQDACELLWSMPAHGTDLERFKQQVADDPRLLNTFHRVAADRDAAPELADFADRLLDEIHNDHEGDQ